MLILAKKRIQEAMRLLSADPRSSLQKALK
jgi:hypothetical protein